MNKRSLIISLIPAVIVGIAIWSPANAQVSDPNYWKKVGPNVYPLSSSTIIGSSTINGSFKNLNVSGTCTGCGAGGVSTSSANSWTGQQTYIGGVGSPFRVNGIATTTITGDGTTSTFGGPLVGISLNTVWNVENTSQRCDFGLSSKCRLSGAKRQNTCTSVAS